MEILRETVPAREWNCESCEMAEALDCAGLEVGGAGGREVIKAESSLVRSVSIERGGGTTKRRAWVLWAWVLLEECEKAAAGVGLEQQNRV